MKCPYCVEEISDEATVCRVCGRELFYGPLDQIVGKISALEKATSIIEKRLDEIEPRDHALIEHQISMLRKDVARIAEAVSAERSSNPRTEPQRNQQDSKRGDQQATERDAAETRQHPIRFAGRYLVDSYTTVDTKRKRIGVALLLAVVGAVAMTQLSNGLGQTLDFAYQYTMSHATFQDDPFQATLTLGWALIDSVYVIGVALTPFIFGFVTSLSWPGRRTFGRLISFILLGVSVGALVWVANMLLTLLGGTWLHLPTVQEGYYYGGWDDVVRNLDYTVVTWFALPISAFVSGGLLADSMKTPKFSQSRKQGFARTIVGAFTRRGREPNPRLVKLVDKLPALLFALIPVIIKSLGG